MQEYIRKYKWMVLLLCIVIQCKKPYTPAILTAGNNYLVIDGFINTSPGGVTTIILSRSKNLTDTVINNIPETKAIVTIENTGGTTYPLQEQATAGTYKSQPLGLDNNAQYRLTVIASNGSRYQSDFVSAKQTPAIDSINWLQDDNGIKVFVNTHDAANNTRYYRWQYAETWEYHSQLQTIWGVSNGLVYLRMAAQQVHVCYNTTLSTNILLGSTAALSHDVISSKLLNTIVPYDSILQYRMSILVQQYALTLQAYSYWQIIQKNSEQQGTLFDLQPSRLTGNIHSLTNAAEPVVGFISANTLQEKRIFISNSDLQNWQTGPGTYECSLTNVPQNTTNFLILNYPDTSFGPYYYISMGPLVLAKNTCLDCTLSGGTTVKPSFW